MIYNYDNAMLEFKTSNNIIFNLQLRPRITIVHGDTATGKSFFVNELEQAKISFDELKIPDLNNVIIYDGNKFPEDTKSLVMIDRGDLVVTDTLAKKILKTKNLHFLIFMRKPISLNLTPNYYGTFVRSDNTVTIDYRFSERL